MFDDLLDQFDQVMADAKSATKNTKKLVTTQPIVVEDALGCDPTKSFGKGKIIQEQRVPSENRRDSES